jgi:hypothetical protein
MGSQMEGAADQAWAYLDANRQSQGPFPVDYLQSKHLLPMPPNMSMRSILLLIDGDT